MTPQQVLEKYFGYNTFRPHQLEAINTLLSGDDALIIMPTGGGKSLIFQIPAMIMDGLAIVVSPLISLMKDQVDALISNGIPAAFVNSAQSVAEKKKVLDDLYDGRTKLLYVAPETLLTRNFNELLNRLDISFFAIDEAHCISSWGHDFRPEYGQLAILKDKFPQKPIVALTATADRITQADIVKLLKIKDNRFISSFDRPNLSLTVAPAQKRLQVIDNFISERPNTSGIIYTLSRKMSENLSAKLNAKGYNTAFYHAKMEPEERARIQEEFINDRIPIICATIAFGMGIDKSNVRWVIHYNLPKNIEGFYQQIGRAGRDGLLSDTVLFYTYGDLELLQKFAKESGQPEIQLEKLKRMQQYAEATTCRRKILLSYFNEQLEENCGNCDICKSPPKTVDGSILAQKALSAILRTKEQISASMTIDILRGSGRKEIYDLGYQKIKTYGAGRELSYFQWQQYLMQMLHHGLFDIDYQDHHKLKVTPYGKKILKGEKKLALSHVGSFQDMKKAKKPKPVVSQKQHKESKLFDKLRELRAELAQENGVPAYIIFSDKSLRQMAEERPVTREEMMKISGVGEHKYLQYGRQFSLIINEFNISEYNKEQSKIYGSTFLFTKKLLDDGLSIAEVAKQRHYSKLTIESHIARLYAEGDDIDISNIISQDKLIELSVLLGELPYPVDSNLKKTFEHFDEAYSYPQIKLGLAHLERQNAGKSSLF
ncbi:MAG TPA: DNA helicase RecQ [Saprospiraceae bacterium]|nr:DNA helicase RecQ [Saprospiraceae bacterium]